jgi:hypothetical protein
MRPSWQMYWRSASGDWGTMWRRNRRNAEIRHPLATQLQSRIHVYKPLCIKNFHEVRAENAHACALNSTIGKARVLL